VIICHATGSAKNPYVAINVAYEGGWVDGHSNHGGDFILKDPAAPGEHASDAGCDRETPSTSTSTPTSTSTSSTSTSTPSTTISTSGTTTRSGGAATTSGGGSGTTSTSGTVGTTTTGAFTPPAVPCPAGAIRVSRSVFIVGRSTVVVIRVLADGRPLAHATLDVLGAGISGTRVTDGNGVATLALSPRTAGVIRLQIVVRGSCPATSRLLRAVASFRPPAPNFTG
jgi:hypothetical protein